MPVPRALVATITGAPPSAYTTSDSSLPQYVRWYGGQPRRCATRSVSPRLRQNTIARARLDLGLGRSGVGADFDAVLEMRSIGRCADVAQPLRRAAEEEGLLELRLHRRRQGPGQQDQRAWYSPQPVEMGELMSVGGRREGDIVLIDNNIVESALYLEMGGEG